MYVASLPLCYAQHSTICLPLPHPRGHLLANRSTKTRRVPRFEKTSPKTTICAGLELKDRVRKMRSYKKVFQGADCVKWLADQGLATSEEQAAVIAQHMVHFEHIVGVQGAADGFFKLDGLYRFALEKPERIAADTVCGWLVDSCAPGRWCAKGSVQCCVGRCVHCPFFSALRMAVEEGLTP